MHSTSSRAVKRKIVLSVASLLAVTALAACGSQSASEDTDGPVVIGVPVGLSGANSVVAPSVIQASELAIEEINEAGGVLGRDVEMKVYDDQSSADGAVKAFNAAVLKDDVVGLVGMQTSAARNAGQPIALKANKPYVYTSTYEGGACAPNLFMTSGVPQQFAPAIFEYLKSEHDPETWFFVGADYAAGRGAIGYLESEVERRGDRVLGTEFNPVDASDWTSILQKVRSADPDVLVTVLSGGAPNVSFFKQFGQGDFDVPHVSFSLDENTAMGLGKDAVGTLYPSPYFTQIEGKKNDAFLEALESKFGKDMETPNFLSVPQYNGIHLLAQAIEEAGATDSQLVIDAIPTVTVEGPAGDVRVDKQHHAALDFYLGEVESDGTTKVVGDFGQVEPGEQCPDLD